MPEIKYSKKQKGDKGHIIYIAEVFEGEDKIVSRGFSPFEGWTQDSVKEFMEKEYRG